MFPFFSRSSRIGLRRRISAIVNETFVKHFLNGENPLGKTFAKGGHTRFQIIGVVRDSPYRSIREPTLPVAYVAFNGVDENGPARIGSATIVVRTASANPLAMASTLRREVPRGRPEFRVSNIRTQQQLVSAQTVRERALAMLAAFAPALSQAAAPPRRQNPPRQAP